jgi:hypothetical protein
MEQVNDVLGVYKARRLYIKIRYIVKAKLALNMELKTRQGRRGMAPLILNLGTRWRLGVVSPLRPL